MPKVSVIMPTFNRSWIIERAINSVLSQTMQDFELIVVDDGSTDDTQEVLRKIGDKRIVLHQLNGNKGPAVARNEGLQLAKGDIIAYLDSDNVWYSNYLEVMITELTPFYVMAFSAQNTFLVSGTKNNMHIIGRQVRDNNYNPDALTRANSIDINCTVHRRSVLDEVGMFDEKLKSLEDWDLFVRIAVQYPFKVKKISQVLGEYYFFLRDTVSTIENSILTDEWLLHHFGAGKAEGDEIPILDKVNKLIDKN